MKGSMRIYPRWTVLTIAATLLRFTVAAQDSDTQDSRAQNWRTVDDFALANGNAEAHGVAVDATGRIYVAGTANGHGIVRYSGDGGRNWSTRDDFVYPSQSNNVFNAVTIDPRGDVFAGGLSGLHWIIQESRDHGGSWQIVDDFFRPMIDPSHPGTNGAVFSLSSDGQGRVYGAGLMRETGPSLDNWWVRGSDSGGTNWDTKLLLFSGFTDVSQLRWAGEDVYVTGSVSDGDVTTGLILRSSDFGATWSTNFQATSEVYNAIGSDPAGNIYAAGNRQSSTSADWLVRKAAPGGTDWTIIDQSTYQDTCGCGVSEPRPHSIAIDALGNICVAGEFDEPFVINTTNGTIHGANQTWFTRQYSAAAGEWSTTDLFSYSTNPTNTHAIAFGTAIAPDGSTFVVGYGTSESGQRRWVVRKGSALRLPPRLQIVVAHGSITVFWPAARANFILEWTDTLINPIWHTFHGRERSVNGQTAVTFDLTQEARFFRLKNREEHRWLASKKGGR